MAVSLTEAIELATQLLNQDADPANTRHHMLTFREVQAIQRLIADAQITLNTLLEGRTGSRRGRSL